MCILFPTYFHKLNNLYNLLNWVLESDSIINLYPDNKKLKQSDSITPNIMCGYWSL